MKTSLTNSLRYKMQWWLFPGLTRQILHQQDQMRRMSTLEEALISLLKEINDAKCQIEAAGKDITIDGPVVFLGRLEDCNFVLEPKIKQEIILGQATIASLLNIAGDAHSVKSCIFNTNMPKTKHINLEINKGKETL